MVYTDREEEEVPWKYLDTGRTEEESNEYCKTNTHSFRFYKHLSLTILIYAALNDVGLYEVRRGIENHSDTIAPICYQIEQFINQYGSYMH